MYWNESHFGQRSIEQTCSSSEQCSPFTFNEVACLAMASIKREVKQARDAENDKLQAHRSCMLVASTRICSSLADLRTSG